MSYGPLRVAPTSTTCRGSADPPAHFLGSPSHQFRASLENMSGSVLDVSDLYFSYGRNPVIDGINFSVPRGARVALIGPSGCGKTTLLKLLAGLLKPRTGSIIIDGKDATRLEPHERNIGMVFQTDTSLFYHLTVEGNIRFPFTRGNKGPLTTEVQDRITEMLVLVDLERYRNASVSRLSTGMRQRVALARSLIYRPALLFLDEPLVGLDNARRNEILNYIRTLGNNTTQIFVTHDDREVRQLATHILVLRDAKILQQGTRDEVCGNPCDDAVAVLLGVARSQDPRESSLPAPTQTSTHTRENPST